MYVANINPGELYVTRKHELISTLLGSCIAVCMRDKFKSIGGKKHHLECAVFGGGNVIQTITSNIGGKNIDFTMNFLKRNLSRCSS